MFRYLIKFFRGYSDEIERNLVGFYFNHPKDKILSIERCHTGTAEEETIVRLEWVNGERVSCYYNISRAQHNELVKRFIST